jgi:flavin-dependent thymidylate synthase
MNVKLISVTPNALELLLGTKSARMRGQDPATMTDEEKRDHWAYMLDTIKSPFEFVDYIFEIDGVSKNFTHQLVRTRTGAYQQETSRALEIDVFNSTVIPEAFGKTDEDGDMSELGKLWCDAMADIDAHYKGLIAAGAELQDARAVCPSNMGTKILAKFNLRTMSDMAKNRLCARTQGEYQDVYREMRRLVLEVHPWADSLLQVACVATGQCAFPRWGGKVVGSESVQYTSGDGKESFRMRDTYQCPFYRPWMNLDAKKEELRQVFWSSAKAEANPVAVNGKSM